MATSILSTPKVSVRKTQDILWRENPTVDGICYEIWRFRTDIEKSHGEREGNFWSFALSIYNDYLKELSKSFF
jgi:hypothetical protein